LRTSDLDLASAVEVAADDFPGYLKRSLDDPQALWAHVYDNQLDDHERVLLLLILTLDPRCLLPDVERAFTAFWEGRPGRHNFLVTLRALEASFIRIGQWARGEQFIDFTNPGVQDFIIGRLPDEPGVLARILQRAVAFEQCALVWNYSRVPPQTSRTQWGAWRVGGSDWRSIRSIAELPLPVMLRRRNGIEQPGEPALPAVDDNYAYPRLRQQLTDLSEELLQAMSRLLSQQRTSGMSLERRLTVIFSAAHNLSAELPREWIQEALELLEESWRRNVGDKDNAIGLIATLQVIMAEDELVDRLIATSAPWFADPLDSAEDYQALLLLRELLEDYYGAEAESRMAELHLPDEDDLKDQFPAFADDEVGRLLGSAGNYDALGDGLSALKETADLLGLDIDESLEEGWQIVSAAEDAAKNEWKDRRIFAPSSESSNSPGDSVLINDMFSTLGDA
jgi:hypothetical protein